MPAGKPPNEFAFEGAARDKAYALEVVDENHRFWRRVVTNEIPPKAEKYNIAVYVLVIVLMMPMMLLLLLVACFLVFVLDLYCIVRMLCFCC